MTSPTQGEHAQTELAHELFAAAQLAPGEGIEDAVSRIAAALTATTAQPAAPQGVAYAELPDVDALAQEIRRVDGSHNLGAGALAEALMPFLRASHGQAPAAGAVAGPVEWPTTCDGKDQEAWETLAQTERYDMTQHPLHYLFLNERTYAARQGWKAGLLYAVEQMKAASPTPAAQADSKPALTPETASAMVEGMDMNDRVLAAIDAETRADSVLEDAAQLAKITQAIRDYHFALDNREHGGVAMARAWNAICDVLNMDWVQGAESAARKQGVKHD